MTFVMRLMNRRAINQPAIASSTAAVTIVRTASRIIACSCAKTVSSGTETIAYHFMSPVSMTGKATARETVPSCAVISSSFPGLAISLSQPAVCAPPSARFLPIIVASGWLMILPPPLTRLMKPVPIGRTADNALFVSSSDRSRPATPRVLPSTMTGFATEVIRTSLPSIA
ncbi:hypothetical protein D3C80_1619600 [compost metagenome]